MTTSINVARAIAKLVAVDALPTIMGHMVLGNLVERDFEPTLYLDGDVAYTPIQRKQVTLRIYQASFEVPDVTKVLAVPELLQLYMQPACIALADSIDSRILMRMAVFQEINPDPLDAETQLWLNRAEQKRLVCGLNAYRLLRKSDEFLEYENPAAAGYGELINDRVGKISGMLACWSRVVPESTCVAFSRDSATLVIRRLSMAAPGTGAISEYSELGNFGIRVVMDYAPHTLRQTFQLSILAGVSVDPAKGVKFEMKETA